jgi:Family of unknown function (DUF5372)
MTTTVTITRCRHALEGQSLVVLGHFRRHGRLELLVVLGDGSKRLIPAEWTDHDQPDTTAPEGVCAAVPQTLGTTADLLVVCGLVSALLARQAGDGAQAARQSPSKEDFHAARTTQSAPTARPCAQDTPDSDDCAARTRIDGGDHHVGLPDREGIDAQRDPGRVGRGGAGRHKGQRR